MCVIEKNINSFWTLFPRRSKKHPEKMNKEHLLICSLGVRCLSVKSRGCACVSLCRHSWMPSSRQNNLERVLIVSQLMLIRQLRSIYCLLELGFVGVGPRASWNYRACHLDSGWADRRRSQVAEPGAENCPFFTLRPWASPFAKPQSAHLYLEAIILTLWDYDDV